MKSLRRSSLFCFWSGSSNRPPDARTSSWTVGECGATSDGLFVQDRSIVSNDSCNIFCWNVSNVNKSMTECSAELWTRVLCFDQINFINCVGMPLVMNERNDLWFPTFPDQVPPCFSEDARPRCNMLVYILSCLFLLQSDHSTNFCRGSVGNLNYNLHSSVLAVFRSYV